MRDKIWLLIFLLLALVMPAQQTIPLFRQTCTLGGGAATLDCRWDNADQSCGYGSGDLYSGGACTAQQCAQTTTVSGSGGQHCTIIHVTHCCAAQITMDAQCQNAVPGTVFFTETTTTFPCC